MTTTEAAVVETTDVRHFRTPLDGIIRYAANRFGPTRAKEMERFFRFAVVGASGAVIDLGLLFILQQTIIPPTRGLTVALASGIAFFTAVKLHLDAPVGVSGLAFALHAPPIGDVHAGQRRGRPVPASLDGAAGVPDWGSHHADCSAGYPSRRR